MHSSLLVIVPSRGRPENIARLVDGWAKTAEPELGSALLVAVDDDDPTKLDYLEAVHSVGFAWLEAGKRRGLGGTLNDYARRYADSYDAIGFMGDDHLPTSDRWDKTLLAALDELGVGLAYGDDGFQRERLPTAVFASSCLVDALGYLSPPALRHFYLDNYWRALGMKLGRLRYLPHVKIEHVHPAAGKAPWDALYAETGPHEQADRAAYDAFIAGGGIDADAELVRANCLPVPRG